MLNLRMGTFILFSSFLISASMCADFCPPPSADLPQQNFFKPAREKALPPNSLKSAPSASFLSTQTPEAASVSGAEAKAIPRTVLALYDSSAEVDIFYTYAHQFAEMPLNYLGVKLSYHDINQKLPDIENRDDIIGVLTWFPQDTKIPQAEKYIHWAMKAIDAGKKYVILGNPGIYSPSVPFDLANLFLKKLGLHDGGTTAAFTYDVEFVYADPKIMNFERKYSGIIPAFNNIKVIGKDVTAHLKARKKNDPSSEASLVVTGPAGGFVAGDFAVFEAYDIERSFRQWYINPFEFFKISFAVPDFPRPDVTTLAGRRVYYSHIDGDGWTNQAETPGFQENPPYSSEVIMNKIIKPHHNLPVTVGPIAANLDPQWMGRPVSDQIARDLFLIPQVETGCHTFSHPFDWSFFNHYTPAKEAPYLDFYPGQGWKKKTFLDAFRITWSKNEVFYELSNSKYKGKENESQHAAFLNLSNNYKIPRAYANEPFNLKLEVLGAIDEINKFAPKDKPVEVYQWSGNTLPSARAIELTKEAHVSNLNGGDSRFDNLFNSYSWVRPLARTLGHLIQVYASASNENMYTHLWRSDFYGFVNLQQTFINTETPIRIKPINLYYHMYSGEKLQSISAIERNLAFIKTQEITPITASHYASTVDGFFSAEIAAEGPGLFKIKNRGSLQNFRLDNAVFKSVDFEKSSGVIGQRHQKGSLYIYLDQTEMNPVISLKEVEEASCEPESTIPYLIESRWRIYNLKRTKDELEMTVQGFGPGEMRWKIPSDGTYEISAGNQTHEEPLSIDAHEGVLKFALDFSALEPKQLRIRKKAQ